ncbi:MAG: hypothetical protein OES12_07385 [Anaerolineae bacterium]|nr:hypothetical protein [Anaerolineae bacterium]
MKTVIGLFLKDEQVQHSIDKLQEAGIARDNIRVLAFEDTVADLLSGHQSVIVTKYVGWGVIVSAAVFGLYELIGRVCDCGINIYGFRIELDKLVLFIVVGAILAALAAYLAGVEHLDGSMRPYTWNVHQGGKVVAVRTHDELETTIMDILHKENGVAIKTLETRLGHLWHNNRHHSY